MATEPTPDEVMKILSSQRVTGVVIIDGRNTYQWQTIAFSLNDTTYVLHTLDDGSLSLMTPWSELDIEDVRRCRAAWLNNIVTGLTVEDDGHDYGCE